MDGTLLLLFCGIIIAALGVGIAIKLGVRNAESIILIVAMFIIGLHGFGVIDTFFFAIALLIVSIFLYIAVNRRNGT